MPNGVTTFTFVCVASAHAAGPLGIVTIHETRWAYCPGGERPDGAHEWNAAQTPMTLAQLETERVIRRRYRGADASSRSDARTETRGRYRGASTQKVSG